MAIFDELYVEAGATFQRGYVVTNLEDGTNFNLTGFTAKVQVRETPTSALIFEVTPTITTATSTITMTFTATQTSLLTKTEYVWAMELTNATTALVIRAVEGRISNSLEIVK